MRRSERRRHQRRSEHGYLSPHLAQNTTKRNFTSAKSRLDDRVAPAMATNVQAHITGTVWKIEVKPGESVDEGQTLVIIESMKMEMPVESPIKGTVEQIAVAEGQAVDEGAVLLTIA
jgi:acetyl-CoA carboxylase biotin carboxyl carrier protein